MRTLRDLYRAVPTLTRRYIVVGTSVYIFEIVIIVVAKALKASDVVAVALSFWLGLGASFLLQKLVTFSDWHFHRRIFTFQVVAFCVLVLFNFGFTLFVGYLLQGIVSAVFSRTIALGITTIWNFYLYKTRIFKPSGKEPITY